ncbi:MAG: hypothetical protein GY925_30135 [Actinomycetia bacterium]|nr:hypothetical protein [Actinomycetes bacterium]
MFMELIKQSINLVYHTSRCRRSVLSYSPDGSVHPGPDVAADVRGELARRAILAWLVAKGRLGDELAEKTRTWRPHGGLSVPNAAAPSAADPTGKPGADPGAERPAERLIRYLARGPYAESKARLSGDETTFFYTAKMNPMLGRNYEMLDPLEALARILSVVPPKNWQSVRYFGWYSNRSRGERRKRGEFGRERTQPPRPASLARQAWAKLIARIWKEDPSLCERCGSAMRTVAFIHQREAIEKILRHVGRWRDRPTPMTAPRAPPETECVRLDPDDLCLDQTVLF